jgi:hypothetical protein
VPVEPELAPEVQEREVEQRIASGEEVILSNEDTKTSQLAELFICHSFAQ